MEGDPERDERHLRRLTDPEPDDEQLDQPHPRDGPQYLYGRVDQVLPEPRGPETSASTVPTTPPSTSPTATRWRDTPMAAGKGPVRDQMTPRPGDGPRRGEHVRVQNPRSAEHLPQREQQQGPHGPPHPPGHGPQPRPPHGRRDDRLQAGWRTAAGGEDLLRGGGQPGRSGRCVTDGHGGSTGVVSRGIRGRRQDAAPRPRTNARAPRPGSRTAGRASRRSGRRGQGRGQNPCRTAQSEAARAVEGGAAGAVRAPGPDGRGVSRGAKGAG